MWFLDQVAEVRATTPRRRSTSTATAYLMEPPADGFALVRLWAGEPARVPCQPGVYSGITTVAVQVDERGRPTIVLGPTTPTPVPVPEPDPEVDDAVPDSPEAVRTETRRKTVPVADSGTWSARFSSWGSWGQSWPGHPYSAGQGTVLNSGTLIGAGFYGSTIKALGAKEITRARLRVTSVRQGTAPWSPVVQLVAEGSKPSGPPTPVGGTVTGDPLYWYDDPDGWVDLAAGQREDLRTGAARGVSLVGGSYGVTSGKGTSGLSLSLTYTVDV